jgi:hypothetical protein
MKRALVSIITSVGAVATVCAGSAYMASNTVPPSSAGETAVSVSIPMTELTGTAGTIELTGTAATLNADATASASTKATTTDQAATADRDATLSGLVTKTTARGSG